MLVKSVSESFYSGLSWGKERCCKSGAEHGAISAILVRIAEQIGALQMKIFSHYASRRNRRTVRAAFEVKKEIPADCLCQFAACCIEHSVCDPRSIAGH